MNQKPTTLVIGAGLIGTSIAMGLIKAGYQVFISDTDNSTLEVACERSGANAFASSDKQIDLVVVATPPSKVAEVIKAALIAHPTAVVTDVASVKGAILDALADPAALDPSSDLILELVRRSVAIKERVTEADFKESGQREFLNYGHTLGHAIELAERYKWRHGAAISIGMVFAAELAQLSGKLSVADVERHREVLGNLGLPLSYRADRWEQLLATMQRDKKSRAGALRFVVLDGIGKPSMLHAPTPELLFTAFQAIVE